MKFSKTIRALIYSWHIWVAEGYGVRFFTFIPRRFTTYYWDVRHCLITVTWWQWFRRCFFIRSRMIIRPEYSSWVQICQRANSGDRDAKFIRKCLGVMGERDYDYCEPFSAIYDEVVRQSMADVQN